MRRKLRKPLAILLAFAMMFCLVPAMGFAADDADDGDNSVKRLSGQNRYETAANIAEDAFPDGAGAVVIANGEPALDYADALAGSFLAGAADAPILLTNAAQLPDATAKAIEKLGATKAYVLGGELAVSNAVVSQLEKLLDEVERVEGQNRFETAVNISKVGKNLPGAEININTALIANGTRPADALAAGAYANAQGIPVLLVNQNNIPAATKAALAGIENTFVIGGNLVVSDDVASELDATRISGRTGNATSVAVAETLWESPENFALVNGADGIVDALAGSVLGMPILYVPSEDVDAYLNKVITGNSFGFILGGVNRISDEFLNEVQQMIEGVEEELQVESVSAINAKKLEVKFSQEVAAFVAGDITITDVETGTAFTGHTAVLDTDGLKATVTLGGTDVLDGDYQVTVAPIASKDDATVKTPLYTTRISFTDTEKPKLLSVTYPVPGEAVLNMSEELDTLPATVTIERVDGEAITTETVTLDPNDASKIIVKPIVADKEYKVTLVGVLDLAGNIISPNPTFATVKSTLVDTVEPEVVSVVSKGLDKVIVTFSEEVVESSIALSLDGVVDNSITAVKNAKNPLEVEITLGADTTAGAHAVELSAFGDLAGNTGKTKSTNVQFTALAAKLAKTTVAADNSKVTLTFDMNVTKTATDVVLTRVDSDMVTTTVTVNNADITAAGAGKDFVLAPTGGFAPGKYTGQLTVADVTPLGATDKIAISFEVKEAVDSEKATPTLGAIDNENVVVTFDKDMGTSALDVANYKVEGKNVFKSAIFDGSAKTVKLTFNPETILLDGDYEFTIESAVKTKAGVAIEAFAEVATFKENVAPTVKKIEFTAPDQIVITFSENVTAAANDFAIVKVGGVEDATKFQITDITGDTATLTLAAPVTDLTKAITVEFDKDIDVTDTNGNVLVPAASYTVSK